MFKHKITRNKQDETIVRTLFACGVNDPVTCVYAQSSTGFFYFGTVTGSVRAVFPSNQATSRQCSDSKTDPQNIYSLVVLTRRSDEGIRTIHADDQGFVFATVGDKHVKVWDMSNLIFDRPLVLGAIHDKLPYSRTHTYTRCINTYVLQGEGTIAMLTNGGHTMHVIIRQPPQVEDQPMRVAEEESTDRSTQASDTVADATLVSMPKIKNNFEAVQTDVVASISQPDNCNTNIDSEAHGTSNAKEDPTHDILVSQSDETSGSHIDIGVESELLHCIDHDDFNNTGSGKTKNTTEEDSQNGEDRPTPRLSLSSHATLGPEDMESDDAAVDTLNSHQPKDVPNSYSTLGFDPFDEPCGALDFPHVSLREERLEFGLPRGTVPMSLTNKYISWIQSEGPNHYVASVWDWRKGEKVWTCSFPQARHRYTDLPLGFLVVDEWLACIHYRRQVVVRDVATGNVVAKLGQHSKVIVAITSFRDICVDGVVEGVRAPVIVTIGQDLKLKVWRDLKLLKTLALPRAKARFSMGLPYLVTANSNLDRFFYTDDAGLHVVEC